MMAGVIQNVHKIANHERLAAGERKLLHAHINGFVNKRLHIAQLHAGNTAITGVAAFQAKRAGQIAGGARVDPQLFQLVCVNVTPGIAITGMSPAVEGSGLQHFHSRNTFAAGRSGFDQGHSCSSIVQE